MSHSPDGGGENADYTRGWSAVSSMIREGGSWSGHERNCCFLNTGDGRFSDVSALSGFDFDQDGRATALVDWDLDGRLDVWMTNRNAPRVRVLRNQGESRDDFLGVHAGLDDLQRDLSADRLLLLGNEH